MNGTTYDPFVNGIQFFDENLIYLGGNYAFLRTSNGADTTIVTGITENTKGAVQPKLYPNPTKDVVNIPCVEGLERVDLYNVVGKLLQGFVMLSDSRSVNKIDISNHEAGTYILKLIMKNGEVFTKKVVKE